MKIATVTAVCVLTVGGIGAQETDARAQKIIAGSCFLCHGATGESSSDVFPKLAGQHAQYIARQLAQFKSGGRKSTVMRDMVAKLTPDDMLALGQYLEKQVLPLTPAADPELARVGQYIYYKGNSFSGVPACVGCHGNEAMGTDSLPRLAGQHPRYLETQLKFFNTRRRDNDNAVMHHVASAMTALEMAAVSEYLGSK